MHSISRIFCEAKSHPKNKKTLPLYLFLETIPYEETRGYGRKIVSSSVYYVWLYEGNLSAKLSVKFLDDELLALTMFSK